MHTSIVIMVNPSERTWHQSAQIVERVLQEMISTLGISDEVVTLAVVNTEMAPRLMDWDSADVTCLICHLSPSLYDFVGSSAGNCCWVFVSGGRSYVPAELELRLSKEPVIWFQGAYNRESHFGQWLGEWYSTGLTRDGFKDTSEVLVSGTTGPHLRAVRFCRSLFPLIVILEGFARYSGLTEEVAMNGATLTAEKRAQMNVWLSTSLREVAQSERVLSSLSQEATLLDGMVKDNRLIVDDVEKAKQLRKLLAFFIPRPGGHAFDYEPELDDDLKRLINSSLEPSMLDQVVVRWLHRLRKLVSILGETRGAHEELARQGGPKK